MDIIIFLYGDTLLSHLQNYTLAMSLFIFAIIILKYLLNNKKSDKN